MVKSLGCTCLYGKAFHMLASSTPENYFTDSMRELQEEEGKKAKVTENMIVLV